jgi:hypothetical protein
MLYGHCREHVGIRLMEQFVLTLVQRLDAWHAQFQLQVCPAQSDETH